MIWFYEKNNEAEGPVYEGALKALLENGKIAFNTRVWKEGMEDWTEYREIFPPFQESTSDSEL